MVTAAGKTLPFAELARGAYMARVPLSATGFYATPKIHYDRKTLTGRPFFYFAYGAAVSEVADRHADRRAPAARPSTSCTTSAPRSIRRSTAARSRAASCRDGAGSRWRSCGGTTTASSRPMRRRRTRFRPRTTCPRTFASTSSASPTARTRSTARRPSASRRSCWRCRPSTRCATRSRAWPSGCALRLDAPATDERILFAVEDLRSRASAHG